ncbi:hypothetical protein NSND_61656 [Nitrospira sp. ND1]|nr:hypothetical protein NSND_61656 [Nitrospira sp. ND1]
MFGLAQTSCLGSAMPFDAYFNIKNAARKTLMTCMQRSSLPEDCLTPKIASQVHSQQNIFLYSLPVPALWFLMPFES